MPHRYDNRPPPARQRARRIIGVTMACFGVIVWLVAALAGWNPWRILALYPLNRVPATIGLILLGGTLVTGGGVVGLAGRGRRVVAGMVVPITVVAAIFPGLLAWWAEETLADRPAEDLGIVAATREHEIVAFRDDRGDTGIVITLVARSRAGIFSREGAEPIATCRLFDTVGEVRFTDASTVALTPGDGATRLVEFDPATLLRLGPAPDC